MNKSEKSGIKISFLFVLSIVLLLLIILFKLFAGFYVSRMMPSRGNPASLSMEAD